jgi:hypothetical protein
MKYFHAPWKECLEHKQPLGEMPTLHTESVKVRKVNCVFLAFVWKHKSNTHENVINFQFRITCIINQIHLI